VEKEMYLMRALLHGSPKGIPQREKGIGLKLKTRLWRDGLGRDRAELEQVRRLGDKHTWMIELDTTLITSSLASDSYLRTAAFSMKTMSASALYRISYLEVKHDILKSCVLRHSYSLCKFTSNAPERTKPSKEQMYVEGVELLRRMLDEATVLQLTMLDPSERPSSYTAITISSGRANEALGNFTVPDWWDYYDEEIQRRLQKLYQDYKEAVE
jgi:hypothetical protein